MRLNCSVFAVTYLLSIQSLRNYCFTDECWRPHIWRQYSWFCHSRTPTAELLCFGDDGIPPSSTLKLTAITFICSSDNDQVPCPRKIMFKNFYSPMLENMGSRLTTSVKRGSAATLGRGVCKIITSTCNDDILHLNPIPIRLQSLLCSLTIIWTRHYLAFT